MRNLAIAKRNMFRASDAHLAAHASIDFLNVAAFFKESRRLLFNR